MPDGTPPGVGPETISPRVKDLIRKETPQRTDPTRIDTTPEFSNVTQPSKTPDLAKPPASARSENPMRGVRIDNNPASPIPPDFKNNLDPNKLPSVPPDVTKDTSNLPNPTKATGLFNPPDLSAFEKPVTPNNAVDWNKLKWYQKIGAVIGRK